MAEGSATLDFVGHDVSKQWASIAAHAKVGHFDVALLPKLGISLDAFARDGSRLEDESLLRTDFPSIQ